MPYDFEVKMVPVSTDDEFELPRMGIGDVAVLTRVPTTSCNKPGCVVVRSCSEFAFISTGTWALEKDVDLKCFRARRLRPGEQINIKGK
jgi:hypothetical protein